ncbi:uncharacterized protein JCM10292_003130 [Rhodotorula paludigena]|uniref:uncharacterized protein n=1 Tax=Rhodotorula paludigena TaxID=86838 RepID=UPI00317C78CB
MVPDSQEAAASPSERPAHHVLHPLTGTLSFKNPWPSASAPTASELLFGGAWLGWPKLHLNKHPKARELQVLDPGDWGRAKVRELRRAAEQSGNGAKTAFVRSTWLGHATVYVQLPLDLPPDPLSSLRRKSVDNTPDDAKIRRGRAGSVHGAVDEEDQYAEGEGTTLKLLFDPIFSERAGPTNYTGPGRLRPAPCKVEDLPGVDAVLISHNHYDHLDVNSVKQVLDKWPRTKFFVPLGNKTWFFASGVPPSQIIELDWWEDAELTPSDFGLCAPPLAAPSPPLSHAGDGLESGRSSRSKMVRSEPPREKERIRFSCVPAQHNSGRSPGDQGSTLWCGWVVEHLIESDPPDPYPFFHHGEARRSSATVSTNESFVSAQEAELRDAMQTGHTVLVEEPEDIAVEEDDADEASGPRARRTDLLNPPSTGTTPFLTPQHSANDLSPQTTASSTSTTDSASLSVAKRGDVSPSSLASSPRRRSSVSQLLQRSSSFSKSLTRRLSNASRSSSPDGSRARSGSVSAAHSPSPLSRASSIRAARERQTEREAAAAAAATGAEGGDGEAVPDPSEATTQHDALTLPASPAPESPPDEVDEEKLAQEEKERESAAKAKRAEHEVGRAVKEGRWTRSIMRKGVIYHAGDTGYRRHRRSPHPVCPAFDEIGLKFGPLDVAFVPIWRGGSLGFVSAIGLRLHHENISSAVHGSPADAVDIHLDVRSRNTIGMHFGTFIGSESESLEAIIELQDAIEEAGVGVLDDPNEDEMGRMGVTDIGETWCTEIQNLLIVS